MLGRVLQQARVHLFSAGLSEEATRGAQLDPVEDLSAAVEAALANGTGGGRVAVLPEGPLTVATVAP